MTEANPSFRSQLPAQLRQAAFWAGDEAAWPRGRALETIGWLTRHHLAVLGGEIWIPRSGGPEIPSPIIYTWDIGARRSDEAWEDYVKRSAEESSEYVRTFDWDPSDEHYRGKEPYFCLEACSEEEYGSWGGGIQF